MVLSLAACGELQPPLVEHGEGDLYVLVAAEGPDAPPAAILRLGADGREIQRVGLPEEVLNPRALAWDGTSMWVSNLQVADADTGPTALYELDPATGEILRVLPDVATSVVAIDGDGLWVADLGGFARIDRTGATTAFHPGGGCGLPINGLSFDGDDLLLLHAVGAAVERVQPGDTDGEHLSLGSPLEIASTFALRDDEMLVVWPASRGPAEVRHHDPRTGELLFTVPLQVEGWIAGIAPTDP